MLSSIVILSTLAASALGSNSTSYSLPASFNIGLVKPDELSAWTFFRPRWVAATDSLRLLVPGPAQCLP